MSEQKGIGPEGYIALAEECIKEAESTISPSVPIWKVEKQVILAQLFMVKAQIAQFRESQG